MAIARRDFPGLGGLNTISANHQGRTMTDDQFWRIAITAAVAPIIWHYLPQKASAYLARKKAETGRGLAERIGHRLGSLWARSKQTR